MKRKARELERSGKAGAKKIWSPARNAARSASQLGRLHAMAPSGYRAHVIFNGRFLRVQGTLVQSARWKLHEKLKAKAKHLPGTGGTVGAGGTGGTSRAGGTFLSTAFLTSHCEVPVTKSLHQFLRSFCSFIRISQMCLE